MLFRQLEYLVALAGERHFARAAQLCGVSQPSLSEAIRKLEEELAVPLIRRGRRFGGLTPEGDRVVAWARQILADRDALLTEVGAMRTGLTGRLRIGTVPSAAVTAPRLIESLRTVHPLLTADVASDLTSVSIVERLRDFSLDAALTYLDDEMRAEFRVRTLYQERYILLVSADRATSLGPVASWAEAAALPLCLLTPAMRGRRMMDACFAEAGAAPVAEVETDSFATVLAHVASGRTAGVVPPAWLHALGIPAGVRAVPLTAPSKPVEIGLVVRARDPLPPAVQALLSAAERADFQDLEDGPVRYPTGSGTRSRSVRL
ncbi:LysR family transcriptional regulator [Amycolatopsis jiangsuensis]|uniref:DNA-binding transcriptional LysR family regulator n=1 Tax=Amycolatopsis jiangsuensis TaxID=1181879 RepID=A0A840IT33_9PSEU|nr:LysR family transcriptional regulator [Amycolatopsis jiangsuensis]MBB4685791.1 DNA-binding transcriptional LysR family regulator [Amycolatopsis jiangsuensis]